MQVLITNGETRPALAITRSLGRLGHDVTVVATRHPSLASASRFCAQHESCPDPQHFPDGYADAIVDIARRRNIGLLLPVNEIAARLIAERRDRLPQCCILPVPSNESLAIANDKARVLELAAQLGIPIPRSIELSAGAPVPNSLQYPVVIKPSRSRVLVDGSWLSAGADYANDLTELGRKLSAVPKAQFPVLVQQRIIGEGAGVSACYWLGRPVVFFCHRRLREKPPSGGVSVLSESMPLDPTLANYAEQLLSALRWHGVAMVEFKRDRNDGSFRLLEINGRFWGSLQLAIDAGIDFPGIVAGLASGATIQSAGDYRIGVRSRWFLGDLDALLTLWKNSLGDLHLPAGHPGRLRTLVEFLKFWHREQHAEVLRLADLSPGLLEIRQWLRGH